MQGEACEARRAKMPGKHGMRYDECVSMLHRGAAVAGWRISYLEVKQST